MIYPLTEQTPVLQHNAALQRYVRRYADIENRHSRLSHSTDCLLNRRTGVRPKRTRCAVR